MARFFVTGGAFGFIGRRVVRRLIARGSGGAAPGNDRRPRGGR